MRGLLSTSAGKAAFGLTALAIALLLLGVVWGLLTDSDQQFDLAIGCLRAGTVLAAVGLLLVLRHRAELRAREGERSGGGEGT